MDAIKVEDLTFSYDDEIKALNGCSFTVPKGSYTTIVGPNGSGKSTVAKLLVGLLEPSGGKILIDGQEMNEKNDSELRRKTGIVFQNPDNQFIGSTVADDIAFGLENRQVDPDQMQQIIEESAAKVGMTNYLNSEPTNLSGGQKQRVAIAGILAVSPETIIFDESTSMLDPQGKLQINKQIKKLNEEKGITVLSITHDMDEVAQSENVIVLNEGKVLMEGTPQEVFRHRDELEKIHLDVPYAQKASDAFMEKGILKSEELTLEGLADRLCQLKQTI